MIGEYTVIGIVGSRSRDSVNDYNLVVEKLSQLIVTEKLKNILICSGHAYEGADSFAETIAERMEVGLLLYLPNWRKRGKAGGPLRNKKIAKSSDYLIACWDGESKGTKYTIDEFKKLEKGKRLIIV